MTGAERGASGSFWLDPMLLRKLEQISVASKGRTRGTMQGKRRSRALGGSQEFADYRPYAPGDDIRRLDWNVYGRTGKAYIRQYWDEQEMAVRLYVDASESMRFRSIGAAEGDLPSSGTKWAYALRLAACVGYAALAGEDRVSVARFTDSVESSLPPLRGKGSASRLFAYLEGEMSAKPAAAGSDDLSAAFLAPGVLPRTPGQAWLLTDGMYERGIDRTLDAFAAAGQEVAFIQVLGKEELSPALSGELKLIDAESGIAKEVAIGPSVLRTYEAALREHNESIRRMCAERGFAYVLVDTSVPLEHTVAYVLLAQGLLKR